MRSVDWQAAVEAEMYQSVPSMRASVLDTMLEYILGAVTSVVTEQLAGMHMSGHIQLHCGIHTLSLSPVQQASCRLFPLL